MKTVLVLCGGRSAEREVSCVSASAVLRNLPGGWKPVLVWIAPDGRWHLQRDARALAGSKAPSKHRFDKNPVRLEPGTPSAVVAGTRRIAATGCDTEGRTPFWDAGPSSLNRVHWNTNAVAWSASRAFMLTFSSVIVELPSS